jgi:predicted Na+-dependent transporter
MASMIATIVTIIIEILLMLGLILCIAYCSGYISLASTSLDKGKFRFCIKLSTINRLLF